MPRVARFPVIIGPTAGGKSSLAVEVAFEFQRQQMGQGEIISADAFQVYRAMDIGTAKPTPDQRAAVTHHLIDILEPDDPEPFSVHRWLGLVEGLLEEMQWGGPSPTPRIPIIAGGTHLYTKALLDGVFEGPGADPVLREQLQAMDHDTRRAELERVDPAAFARIHPNDARRTIRALEVFRLTGKPISDWQGQWDTGSRPDCLLVILDWQTEAINRRINARIREMVDQGLVAEVQGLHESGRLGPLAAQALGYKQILAHIAGDCTLDDSIERIKIETRRFAKNQRTWLRRLKSTPGSVVVSGDEGERHNSVQTIVNASLKPVGHD